MKETDYGQHLENHPSIIAIHEKNSTTDALLCFNFEHINQARVERILLDVNVHKSCDHDMLSLRLGKESASKPITNILNTSIKQGCHPNAWKMGQVTPLLKKTTNIIKQSCALVKDYLSGRQQRVKIGDTFSNRRAPEEGFHKGAF